MKNQNQTIKTNQYYGLRLIKLIYKMLCLLVVITALGGLGYISLQALNMREVATTRFAWWLPQALSLVIGGGLLALTFYVIAQVIEVQLAVNTKLNHILKDVQRVPETLQTFEVTSRKMVDEMEKMRVTIQNQARLSRLQNSAAETSQQTTTPPVPTRKTP